jgi:membrane protein DedA with SNARE-associated domain
MAEFAIAKRKLSRRWEYAAGILALAVVISLAVLVSANWHDVRQVAGYGYFGVLVLSILGGATIPIPIPVTAVYFALGGIIKTGPDLVAPGLIGLVGGIGETLGGLTTYATGYSGGATLAYKLEEDKPGRMMRVYRWMMSFMNRRGGLVLFAVSALINPFYYPVALSAGLTRFGVKRFTLICLTGKFIKCAFVAYAGYFGLRGLFELLGIKL